MIYSLCLLSLVMRHCQPRKSYAYVGFNGSRTREEESWGELMDVVSVCIYVIGGGGGEMGEKFRKP